MNYQSRSRIIADNPEALPSFVSLTNINSESMNLFPASVKSYSAINKIKIKSNPSSRNSKRKQSGLSEVSQNISNIRSNKNELDKENKEDKGVNVSNKPIQHIQID